MGKFNDYVDAINQQSRLLRNNLTKVSGVDCTNMSIGNCATIVNRYIPDNLENDRYIRPDWYPNIKEILNSSPIIEKDSVKYYPAYIILLYNYENITPFHKTGSGVSAYMGTGGDAVLCSDSCDNDIKNANEISLEVGTTINHAWDVSKDIGNNNSNYKVRWAIIYIKKPSTAINVYLESSSYIEMVSGNMTFGSSSFATSTSGTYITANSIKFIEMQHTTTCTSISQSALNNYRNLEEIIFPESLTSSSGLNNCYNLKRLHFPKNVRSVGGCQNLHSLRTVIIENEHCSIVSNVTFSSCAFATFIFPPNLTSITIDVNMGALRSCSNLETLILPLNLTKLVNSSGSPNAGLCYCCPKLAYVKIPSTVTTMSNFGTKTFSHVRYFELWDDFNINGTGFEGIVPKSSQWLKDLCVWLKDRTGEDANTMTLGSKNLTNAQNIWLTFNPNDKRDITWVAAGTEGAINIVQFITEQLNWTLS